MTLYDSLHDIMKSENCRMMNNFIEILEIHGQLRP